MEPIRGFGIDRVAVAADAGGRSVLRMENLDTDLPLPPEAVLETVAGLATPEANSWLPFTGDLDLRAAISEFTEKRTGHRYDPVSEIVVTVGGMEGLLNVLLALVDPGDEVVVTDPTYAGIVNRIRLAGGTPSMPSGGYLDENDWRTVCELCRERDLFLVYDAAMERLLFDGRPLIHPLSLDGMSERTVVVGSLSKEHRMIGWRVGWVAGPESTVTDVGWAHVYNTTCPVSIARRAGAAVLRGDQGHVEDCVIELERRRDTMLEGLSDWPFVTPAGGWSLLLDVTSLGFEPEEASQLLLEESQIAATGMRGWGDEVAERYVRFVFSAEPVQRLEEIPERLAGGKLAAAVSALT